MKFHGSKQMSAAANRALLESKGVVIPEGAKISSWIAPNAPSGNVIGLRIGNTFQLYDKTSGKLFATTNVAANATMSKIAETIRNVAGNTAQFQQQQATQQVQAKGFAEDSPEAAFARATGRINDIGKYDFTVDQQGNVVAISKTFAQPMFEGLGATQDVVVIDPSTNEIVKQEQTGEELVWDQFNSRFATASSYAKILQQKKDEFYDQLDKERGLSPGTTKGLSNLMNGLIQVSDKLATAASFIGVPTFIVDIYKTFAPPGSEFYKPGTTEEKFERLIKDPTFLTTIATGGLGQALTKFKGLPTTLIQPGSDLDKALKAVDVLVKTTNLGAKVQETAGETIEEKVRNFAANKADKAVTAIELVSKDTAQKLAKSIEENIRMPTLELDMKTPQEVGTTTITEPVAPPQEPGETLEAPEVAEATGEITMTDPLAQTLPAVKTGGVVESSGQRNLRKFRQNGNRFKAKGGAFGASRF